MGKVARIITLVAILAVLGLAARSQDLGTSNKLFAGSKPEAAGTAKKKTSKPKSTARKVSPKKVTAKKSAASNPPVRTGMGVPEKKVPTSSPRPAARIDAATSVQFDKLLEAGDSAKGKRNYPLAESTYRRAQGLIQSDARAAYRIGNIFVEQHRWEDAEREYRSALQNDVGNAGIYIALSRVLTIPIASPHLSERYTEAEQLARKAVSIESGNAMAYDQLGVALEMQGLIGSETGNAYLKAIALSPEFAQAYAHLGRFLRRGGKRNESIDAYNSAVAKAKTAPHKVRVAEVFQSEQRFAESVSLLRRALTADPQDPSALLMLGRALTATGDLTEAESVLRKAVTITSGGYSAEYLLGRLYLRQGRFADAEMAFISASRTVTALNKYDLAAQFEAVGDGYAREGKSAKALGAYRRARAFDPELKSVVSKIARIN